MTTLEKNIEILETRLVDYAEKNLFAGFHEAGITFAEILKSAFSEDEIDEIYNELDEECEFDYFLTSRKFCMMEKDPINLIHYLLDQEIKGGILSAMEEIAPE
jgi:hypothetical protein